MADTEPRAWEIEHLRKVSDEQERTIEQLKEQLNICRTLLLEVCDQFHPGTFDVYLGDGSCHQIAKPRNYVTISGEWYDKAIAAAGEQHE